MSNKMDFSSRLIDAHFVAMKKGPRAFKLYLNFRDNVADYGALFSEESVSSVEAYVASIPDGLRDLKVKGA